MWLSTFEGRGDCNAVNGGVIIVLMDREKINAATRQILDACYTSSDAVVSIGQEIDELRRSGTWTGSELRQLQVSVLAVLRGLVEEEEESETELS